MNQVLGSLPPIATCQVLKYLEYDFINSCEGIRFISKKFCKLINEYGQYINSDKKVLLKIDIDKIFKRETRMPILKHPYYKNTSQLKIIINASSDYYDMIMEDLFKYPFFPNLRDLKIAVIHNYE